MEVFGNPPQKIQIFPVPGTHEINVNGVIGSLLIRELDLLFNLGRDFPSQGTLVMVGNDDALAICTIVTGMIVGKISDPNVYLVGRYGSMVRHDIQQAGMSDIIKTQYGDPILLSELFKNESVDRIYIDSNHTYDGFMEELRAWLPKRKRTGVFCGHDGCGNVRRALRDFCEETGSNLSIVEPPQAHFLWTLTPAL